MVNWMEFDVRVADVEGDEIEPASFDDRQRRMIAG